MRGTTFTIHATFGIPTIAEPTNSETAKNQMPLHFQYLERGTSYGGRTAWPALCGQRLRAPARLWAAILVARGHLPHWLPNVSVRRKLPITAAAALAMSVSAAAPPL